MTMRRISVLLVLPAVLNLCVVARSVTDTLVLRRRNPDGWFNLLVPVKMSKVERFADVDGGLYRSDALKINYDYWTFQNTPHFLRGNDAHRPLLPCDSKTNARTWRANINGQRALLQTCLMADETNGFRYLYYATFPRVRVFDGETFHYGMFNIRVAYKNNRDTAAAARIVRSLRLTK